MAEPGTAPCPVCPRHCAPPEGQPGVCRARVAQGGRVVAANYGQVTALALDPIEKKPLARFRPGHTVLSVGSFGCNLACPFCQNHEIAQSGALPGVRTLGPEELARQAAGLADAGNIGLAFTYNEPAVGWEYVRDAARAARQLGLQNVMVTNGYFCPEILAELAPYIDAFNIDLKCFTEAGYRSLGGDLEVVKGTIAAAAAFAHVEVTTLVVPGLADSADDMAAEARWLAGLSPDIPLHVSRYFPRWQATAPATPVETVRRLAAVAGEHLRYVYTGNL